MWRLPDCPHSAPAAAWLVPELAGRTRGAAEEQHTAKGRAPPRAGLGLFTALYHTPSPCLESPGAGFHSSALSPSAGRLLVLVGIGQFPREPPSPPSAMPASPAWLMPGPGCSCAHPALQRLQLTLGVLSVRLPVPCVRQQSLPVLSQKHRVGLVGRDL